MGVDAIYTSAMNLHPEPATNGRMTLSGLGLGNSSQFTVRSADGRSVQTERATGADRLLVDLGGLPNGVNLREVIGDRHRYRGTVLRPLGLAPNRTGVFTRLGTTGQPDIWCSQIPSAMQYLKPLKTTILGATLLGACTSPAPCPPAEEHYTHPVYSIPMETDANIALVESYLNAVISADADAIRASVAPGFYSNNTFVPADSSDVEEIIANWMRIDSTRTDQKIVKDFAQSIQVAEGNEYPGQWVQYWGKYSAMHNATGKPLEVKFLFDANVKDGKLTKAYMWFDRLASFHQLGIPPPEAPAAKD